MGPWTMTAPSNMPIIERGDVATTAAEIIRSGRRPTVREIAERLKPIGNSTVATAFREWMRETLLALTGTAIDLRVVEQSDRRVAISIDGDAVFVFIGDLMVCSTIEAMSETLARDKVLIAKPSEGGGIVVTLPNEGAYVRLTSDEYAFLSGKIAVHHAIRHGEAA